MLRLTELSHPETLEVSEADDREDDDEVKGLTESAAAPTTGSVFDSAQCAITAFRFSLPEDDSGDYPSSQSSSASGNSVLPALDEPQTGSLESVDDFINHSFLRAGAERNNNGILIGVDDISSSREAADRTKMSQDSMSPEMESTFEHCPTDGLEVNKSVSPPFYPELPPWPSRLPSPASPAMSNRIYVLYCSPGQTPPSEFGLPSSPAVFPLVLAQDGASGQRNLPVTPAVDSNVETAQNTLISRVESPTTSPQEPQTFYPDSQGISAQEAECIDSEALFNESLVTDVSALDAPAPSTDTTDDSSLTGVMFWICSSSRYWQHYRGRC